MIVSILLLVAGLEARAAYLAGVLPVRWTLGGSLGPDVLAVPAWLTPLTATLIHGSALHLILNGITFFYMGHLAERALGWRGMLVLYVAGAYAAAIAQWAMDPRSLAPMIGASGAISAVMAAYALLFAVERPRRVGPFSPRVVQVAGLFTTWVVVNILMGIAGAQAGVAIATAAHVGGFAAGLLLARPLLMLRWRRA